MLLRPATILGTAFALVQCATGPSLERWEDVSPEDEVVVAYLQPVNREKGTPELQQTLVSEAVVAVRELYSSPDSDPLMKVAAIADIQLLLDGMATAGFFERAQARPFPNSSAVVVKFRDRSWALSRHAGMTEADFDVYRQSLSMFQNVYNGTDAFHVGPGDSRVFEAEQERLTRQLRDRLRAEPQKGNP